MSFDDHSALARALMPAVIEAGAALLRFRGNVAVERKADDSPVTAADRAAEDVVLAALASAAPGIAVIAEEQVAGGNVPAAADRAFLVDALDGTSDYIAGGDDFTVNIALVEAGAPVFGLVFAPVSGRIFATLGPQRAAHGRVIMQAGERAAAPELTGIATAEPARNALRVLTSRSHLSEATKRFLLGLQIASQRGIGSSMKFGLIAAGEADLYPRFGPTSAWDTAAGHAVLVAAGGAVTTSDGKPLRYLHRPGEFLNPAFIAWGRPGLVADVLKSARS